MMPAISVQSPRAYDLQNLTAAKIAARMAAGASAVLRADLATALQDSGYRYVLSPAEISDGLTDADVTFGLDVGDPRRYGAGTGETDTVNHTAIQTALRVSKLVRIAEAYTVDDTLTQTLNGQTVVMDENASITLGAGIDDRVLWTADTLVKLRYFDCTFHGNGMAGFSNILLDTCTDVRFDGCEIKYAGAQGIQLESCVLVFVDGSEVSENYFYGVSDRDGIRNHYTRSRYFNNGNTPDDDSAFGRGINFWRCIDGEVTGNSFIANTEYGFRLYSEAADVGVNRGHRIVSNYFEDNARADLVFYDESLAGDLVREFIVADIIIRRTTDPTVAASVLCHGGDYSMTDVHIFKEGTIGAFAGFYFYYAVRVKLNHSTANNFADCMVMSNVTGCTVDGFEGVGVATAIGPAGIIGANNIVRNSRFTHGGAGAADVAIINYNATGRNFYFNVECVGFAYGFYISTESVSIKLCKTSGSTVAGFRKDGDAQANQEYFGNSWDSSNPAVLQNIDRLDGRPAHVRYTAEPSIRTWAVGDEWTDTNPISGQPAGGFCTVAGTPGTWVNKANLQ